jgi:hypothetical protein
VEAQAVSEKQNVGVHVATWASWRALIKALRGNALATFPPEAFEADVVVHRFLAIVSSFSIDRRRSPGPELPGFSTKIRIASGAKAGARR